MKSPSRCVALVSMICICCAAALYPYVAWGEAPDYTFYHEIEGHTFTYAVPFLAVDGMGGLWLCGEGLVCRFNGNGWEDFRDQPGGGHYISSSGDGSIWIAGNTNLALYDGESWTCYDDIFDGQNYTVRGISSHSSGTVYLSVLNQDNHEMHLGIFDNGELTLEKEGLLQNHITRLTATPDGVWILYYSSFDQFDCSGDNCPMGISFYDGASFRHYTVENGLPGYENDPDGFTDVSWIINARHKEDTAYMISNSYFGSLSSGEWTTITDHMWGILHNGYNDKIWNGNMGSRNGCYLRYYDGSNWIEYDVSEIASYMLNTYSYPSTHSIAETPDGNVWMGTSHGVLRINPSSLSVIDETSVVAQPSPGMLEIYDCFPNPFNSGTTIQYNLSGKGNVAIKIYSVSGQVVKKTEANNLSQGRHTYLWNGRDERGIRVSSGVYVVVVESRNTRRMKTVTYLK